MTVTAECEWVLSRLDALWPDQLVLTSTQCAEVLAMTPRAVRQLVDRGELKVVAGAGRVLVAKLVLARFIACNDQVTNPH